MRIIDENAKKDIRPYLFQSFLAVLAIFFILIFLDVLRHAAIIASLGSSAFLVFTRPRAYASRPRRLIGGYCIGIMVGVGFHFLSLMPKMVELPLSMEASYILFSALAVGFAILFMVLTSTDHAPAAGMALSMVMNSWETKTVLFVLVAVLLMALMRHILEPFMIDLI